MRQKTKEKGAREKLDGGGKRRGKKAIKVESRLRNSSLKTGRKLGPCFVSRTSGLQRIDGCRSQPVQARTKARMAEKRKQQWRESEGKGGRAVERVGGLELGERGCERAGVGSQSSDPLEEARFHRRTLGLIHTDEHPLPPQKGNFAG